MVDRLSVVPILRGHWRGLTRDAADGRTVPDNWTRLVLVVPAVAVFAWALLGDWTVAAPVPLLTGVTLLSGGILSVFAQLSTLRLKLAERSEDPDLDVERDGIDEAVAHLLTALLLCVLIAGLIIIGLNVSASGGSSQMILVRPWAAFVLSAMCYLGVLFVVIIPKLYSAYVEMNKVRTELNGFYRPASRLRSRLRR